MRGMMSAVEDLDAFLDALMVDEDVLPEQVVLFGFSQGTMMSLHVAPRREDAVAGIVAFSGRLLNPEALAEEARVKPPVLLVHGDADDVVPRRPAAGFLSRQSHLVSSQSRHAPAPAPHGAAPASSDCRAAGLLPWG